MSRVQTAHSQFAWTADALCLLQGMRAKDATLAAMADAAGTSRPEVQTALDYLKGSNAASALSALNARWSR